MTFDHTGWVRGRGLTREIPGGQHGGENGSLKERRDKIKAQKIMTEFISDFLKMIII